MLNNLLKIIISIEHPAWAHQFKYIIKKLEKKDHSIKVVAINKDRNLELLDAFNIKYDVISNTSGKNLLEKFLIFLITTWKILLISIKFKPNLFLGRASPMMAINSFLFRKKHIVFEDTEIGFLYLLICKLFSTIIITPFLFSRDLGKKHLRIHTYKELFYLHPNYFKPDSSVLEKLGISKNEKFIVVRFVSWTAIHDIGQKGIRNRVHFIRKLEKYGRVLITSEGTLEEDLEIYRITIPPEKFHSLLWYATLYIGEGATIASESAILGTPSIYISSITGSLGCLDELEQKYDLMYSFASSDDALKKATELILTPNAKENWRIKRKRLLKDKINFIDIMVWFIENYPQRLTHSYINKSSHNV